MLDIGGWNGGYCGQSNGFGERVYRKQQHYRLRWHWSWLRVITTEPPIPPQSPHTEAVAHSNNFSLSFHPTFGNQSNAFMADFFRLLWLQSTTNLIAPVVWKSMTNTVVTANGTNDVILPLSSQTAFFSLNHGVDATTMNGKLLMGYQGWFACPNDGTAPNQWWHWFHNQTPTAANVNTDFLPDTSEFTSNELFNTGMTYSNVSPVQLTYSSAVQESVLRHFQWMKENQLDGVFLQRFLSDLSSPQFFSFRNQVTANVHAGAESPTGWCLPSCMTSAGNPTTPSSATSPTTGFTW